MINWAPDDAQQRWIYRTLLPHEELERLAYFRNMEETNAEADWNLRDEATQDGLTLSQRTFPSGNFPRGLSFFAFQKYHGRIVTDVPNVAESRDTFSVVVENNPAATKTNAYTEVVTRKRKPKKVRNQVGLEVTLQAYLCYKCDSDLFIYTPHCQFTCICDNNPEHHRTVAPTPGFNIPCNDVEAAYPAGAAPPLLSLLDPCLHCIRLLACAEPRPFRASYDKDVHGLARELYRGFDTDCDEDVSNNIRDVLHFLDAYDYSLWSLKLLQKDAVVNLLRRVFDSDGLTEEDAREVAARVDWMQMELERKSATVDQSELIHAVPKLQVAFRYGVECSRAAFETIDAALEHSLVPEYRLLPSTSSYRAVLSFGCDYVPVHLLALPVVTFEGRELVPDHPAVVEDLIVDHDVQSKVCGSMTEELDSRQDMVSLATPTGEGMMVGLDILNDKRFWSSKWQCIATAKVSQGRCRNRTHHDSRRCHLHRDALRYPVADVGEEVTLGVSSMKL